MLGISHKVNSKNNPHRLTVVGLLFLFGLLSSRLTGDLKAQSLTGQQAKPTQSETPAGIKPNSQPDDQSKLTDGLLDLLTEPTSADKSLPSQPRMQSQPNQSAIEVELGKRNAEQGKQPTNPLVDVRSKMLQAATMLQQPKLKSTLKVQSEIVQQLDELISQLEQQENSQQKNSQRSSKQRQTSEQQSQSQLDNQSMANNKSKQTTAGEQPGNERTDQAKAGDMSVRTKDPSALQQNVWGHLPSKVRAQMESRMVEEFLPSYRAKIEEYYRSLMEESERK